MPLYEYKAQEGIEGCSFCSNGFEWFQKASDSPLRTCPECGAPVRKLISTFSVGASRSGFDDQAKNAGFHKLQKVSKGEYEKKY